MEAAASGPNALVSHNLQHILKEACGSLLVADCFFSVPESGLNPDNEFKNIKCMNYIKSIVFTSFVELRVPDGLYSHWIRIDKKTGAEITETGSLSTVNLSSYLTRIYLIWNYELW